MEYYNIPAAIMISVLVMFVFSLLFKDRRPAGGPLLFFLVVFLATWAGQLWIQPVGPMYKGIAWVPLIFISVFFSLFVMALSPRVVTERDEIETEATSFAVGIFFWLVLILLVMAIVVAYYRLPGIDFQTDLNFK